MGDLLLGADFNVTGIRDPGEIERRHFLDALSLLGLAAVLSANRLGDVGSGGGLPALVLALALPKTQVTAIESQRKKCAFVGRVAETLGLANVTVCNQRAEDYGCSEGRESQDVVVSRAVAPLSVVAEYSVPLLRLGGAMVAMKGAISDQERIEALIALGILGAERLEAVRLDPFPGAKNRWAYLATKALATPAEFPRRAGIPAKRPLGRSLGRLEERKDSATATPSANDDSSERKRQHEE